MVKIDVNQKRILKYGRDFKYVKNSLGSSCVHKSSGSFTFKEPSKFNF
jgi:hypothetical protein